jgi:TorA maturation chaperone TorD
MAPFVGGERAANKKLEAMQSSSPIPLDREDSGRQQLYALIARLLSGRADVEHEMEAAAHLAQGDHELNRQCARLRDALAQISQEDFEQRYHDLFIGLGRGELLPFGSFYLTGFLNEKPLAALRRDLARLGFARAAGVHEPEDHVAALCDVMAQLIGESATGEFSLDEQKRFFAAHMKPWAAQFFADLETAKSAGPFAPLGRIGQIFMTIETEGFGMLEPA